MKDLTLLPSWRIGLARVIYFIHIGCILFLVLGWLLPQSLLLIHICSVPVVILQWFLNKDQCVLTQLQLKLEGKDLDPSDEGSFTKDLFSRMGLEFTQNQLMLIIYALLLGAAALSAIRLWV